MMPKEIVNQYRSGDLSKREVYSALFESARPVFQLSSLMEALNMTWTLGVHGEGTTASINVPVSETSEQLTIKLHIDEQDYTQIPFDYIINDRLPESEELQIFFSMLPDNGVFVDIGANIGWYSILAALNGAYVYAFEPIPETYQRLTRNIALNHVSQIKTFPVGLGEKRGSETFYYNPNASGSSSRADLDYFGDGRTQVVNSMIDTLDHIACEEQFERVDLIKCDIEGAELFAFRGAVETIKKFRPFVICEMLRKWSAKFDYYPDDIIHLFSDMGYVCVALCRNHPGESYLLTHMLESTAETNFLFVPEEKVAEIKKIINLHDN